MSHRKWWALCALFIVPALTDCATLEPFATSTCGNGVVDEDTEDCDTFPSQPEGKRLCGGASGATGQCRLLCNRADAECPPGWGCSVEGFCRRPKGAEFELATEGVSVGVSSLVVGDFDGDGRKDIFGTSALVATSGKGRFHYFGAEAALTLSVPLPANITSPFAYDFDGDGRDDLVFGYNFRIRSVLGGGIAVVQGQADRAIAPKLFPSFQVDEFEATLVPLAGPAPTRSDQSSPYLGVGRGRNPSTNAEVSGIRSADVAADGTPSYTQLLPLAADQIAGAPISAQLFPRDTTSTCGEVVVAFSSRIVNVYSPCTTSVASTTRWAPERPPISVDLTALPPNRPIIGIHVADEDDDGNLDLLIGVQSQPTTGPGQGEEGARVYVARGDGRQLAAAVPLSRDRMPNLPLASGDINGDKITDFVLPGAVLVSLTGRPLGGDGGVDAGDDAGDGGTPSAATRFPLLAPSKNWTSAILADVNADGVLDVVGASTEAPDVDVMEGRLGDDVVNMTAFSMTTTGVVTTLTSADVDGDRTNDVVIVQRRATAEKLDWEIAVAYGRPSTMPPETPRTVGRTRGFRQVFADEFGVGIVTHTEQKPKLPLFSLAFLLGAGERQPFAPIILQTENALAPGRLEPVGRSKIVAARNWVPRTVAPGAFAVKGQIDLGAVAQGTPENGLATAIYDPDAYGLWVSAGGRKDTLEFSPATERLQLTELEIARPTSIQLQMKVKDIDGDGIDEVVTVTPDTNLADGSGQVAIRIIRPNRQGSASQTKVLVEKRSISAQGRLELVDMDQDGNLDLVAILVERDGTRATPKVNVFSGDGAGGFNRIPKSYDLVAATATDDEKKSAEAVGVAVLTTFGARRDGKASEVVRELVVLTRQRLFRVKPGKDSVPVEITGAFRGRSKLDDASDIATGDFDGDGVEDVALAAGGTIRVLRQIPELR